MAKRNLVPYENVTLLHADAVNAKLKRADIVYVNAGVIAPPAPLAEEPEARRPHDLSVAAGAGYRPGGHNDAEPCQVSPMRIVGGSWFIPCSGASNAL